MRHLAACATAAIAASATSALAGPLLTVQASVGGFASMTTTSNGASTDTAGRFSYIGGLVNKFPNPDWAISWDLVGDDTAVFSDSTFITNGFRVQNLTNSSKTFDITVTLESAGPANLQLLCDALFGGTLTSDVAGGTATLTSSGPLWLGQINGISRASTGIMSGANLSTGSTFSFGPVTSDWTGTVTGDLESVGYRLQFTLGANSTALFSGYWFGEVVPTPGAFAAFCMAATIAGRRRRT